MEINKTIYISGMTCGSCERLVTKAIESAGGKVHSISASSGTAVVDYPKAAAGKVMEAIASAGYTLADAPPQKEGACAEECSNEDAESPDDFAQELCSFVDKLFSGDESLANERLLLFYSAASLILMGFMGFFLYLVVFRNLAGFASHIPFAVYTVLSSVAITAAIAHYQSHRGRFNCMEGMMIGMTIGMMSGFLFGAIIGATNGMFVGSVFGMAVGIIAGAWCGKCCGIMGVMEGIMGGLMAGTMGAMLTVMMLNDNLMLFMPLLFGTCIAILAGMIYMIHSTAGRRMERRPMGFASFFAIAFLFCAATIAVMQFAPRSGIVV